MKEAAWKELIRAAVAIHNSEPARVVLVPGNYSPMLGVRAAIRRTLPPDGDRIPEGLPVGALWQEPGERSLESKADRRLC